VTQRTLRLRKEQICRIASTLVEEAARGQGMMAHTPPALVIMMQLLVGSTESAGIALLDFAVGPWTVDRSGPLGSAMFPAVVREGFALLDHELVDSIAGLLNWCEVPVPDASIRDAELTDGG